MVYGNIGIRKNLETFQTSTQGIESQVLMEKGSSLYIGGSVTFAEYRKRHKLETGNDILESKLYLKTHKTKDQMLICGKSKRVWNTFTRNIKHKLGEGAEEEDVELNETIEEIEGEVRTNNDVLNVLPTIPEEQILDTWIQTTSRVKKGRMNGLSSEVSILGRFHVDCATSYGATHPSVSQEEFVNTNVFEQTINRIWDKRMEEMRVSICEEVEVADQTIMSRLFSSQPSPNSSGSSS